MPPTQTSLTWTQELAADPTQPFHGLPEKRIRAILDWMAGQGMFDDPKLEPLPCDECGLHRQVILERCTTQGCHAPRKATSKQSKRNPWGDGPPMTAKAVEARQRAFEAELEAEFRRLNPDYATR